MDSRKAGGMEFTINLITPDNDEKFTIELSSATLTNIEGFLADDPDLTITINRSELELVMSGEKSLVSKVIVGKAILNGDATVLSRLSATLVDFELGFEILPGTKGDGNEEKQNPFQVNPVDQNRLGDG
jgi:alkyl sulfatase BDS1-like metallo-beta-lactamase superfamily hydrolase